MRMLCQTSVILEVRMIPCAVVRAYLRILRMLSGSRRYEAKELIAFCLGPELKKGPCGARRGGGCEYMFGCLVNGAAADRLCAGGGATVARARFVSNEGRKGPRGHVKHLIALQRAAEEAEAAEEAASSLLSSPTLLLPLSPLQAASQGGSVYGAGVAVGAPTDPVPSADNPCLLGQALRRLAAYAHATEGDMNWLKGLRDRARLCPDRPTGPVHGLVT